MTLLAQNARLILDQALAAEVGIIVRVEPRGDVANPASRAKQVLYRFKSESSDYDQLQILFDPDDPETRLWILKREPDPTRNERSVESPVEIDL